MKANLTIERNQTEAYTLARAEYAKAGIDTDEVIRRLSEIPVSLHCWQGDDVTGFDSTGVLTGGIQATGNYPGRARNVRELFEDIEEVIKLTPGRKKLNIHASYAIFDDERCNRDALEPEHFGQWVELAQKYNMGIDFNPTFFSHPNIKDNLTLTSPDEDIRSFWIRHGRCCVRIAQYFAEQTGMPCVLNFWIGDGYKDIPADRLGPRLRYRDSLEKILAEPHDPAKVKICVESKVFGIGVESYTAGSSEFALTFAATHEGVLPLMDNGHYHPTEVVSDKIPALLAFFDEIALHITRPVRWDSDHVVLYDDETCEMAAEIVRNNALNRVYMALDYFDASVNRIGAWAVGFRSWQKALLKAMLTPHADMKKLQDEGRFSELMALREAVKMYPIGAVWDEYCRYCRVKPEAEWFEEVMDYEKTVLMKRAY